MSWAYTGMTGHIARATRGLRWIPFRRSTSGNFYGGSAFKMECVEGAGPSIVERTTTGEKKTADVVASRSGRLAEVVNQWLGR